MSDLRTDESAMSIAVLRILADSPNGEATTKQIKIRISKEVDLTPADQKQSDTRVNEEVWEQIVRNIVSHQTIAGNIIAEGFANIPSRGKLRITAAGRLHVQHNL